MTRPEREAAVVRAAMGKQWALLALWIEQGMPFPLMHSVTIVRDIRALDKACAALHRQRGRK